MNRSALLPGLILIGLGLYFFLKEMDILILQAYLNWQLILIIIGSAFIITSLSSPKQKMFMLPGAIMFLYGAYVWGLHPSLALPTRWSIYPGLVGLAFLFTFLRTKETGFLIPAGILLLFCTPAYLL